MGGTIVVCPGRYVGMFSFRTGVTTLIGAGRDYDSTTNTVLDAYGLPWVVSIPEGAAATIKRVYISSASATGIRNRQSLALFDCTVTGSHSSGPGAGIHNQGVLEIINCKIHQNDTQGDGAGLFNAENGKVTISNSDLISNNAQGESSKGGGIYNEGILTFSNGCRVVLNRATDGGGIFNTATGTITLNDTDVFSNHPNDCVGC